MKGKITIATCIALLGLYNSVKAQQATLVADQNPRYMESEAKYTRVADTLTSSQGTTIQNTYKAYDWYEARQERRQQNREWRANSYYDYSPTWGLYGSYGFPYSGYGYGNRWGYGGYGRGRGRVGIGFGFGW